MKLLLYTATFLILFACNTVGTTSEKEGTHQLSEAETALQAKWQLHWMEGFEADTATFRQNLPMLEFNPRDSAVVGFTGCNRLTGNIATTGKGAISFAPIGTTRMYCEGIPEAAFLDALTKTNQYKIEQQTLWLLADGKKLLGFKKVNE